MCVKIDWRHRCYTLRCLQISCGENELRLKFSCVSRLIYMKRWIFFHRFGYFLPVPTRSLTKLYAMNFFMLICQHLVTQLRSNDFLICDCYGARWLTLPAMIHGNERYDMKTVSALLIPDGGIRQWQVVPLIKSQQCGELWCCLKWSPGETVEQTIELSVIWYVMTLMGGRYGMCITTCIATWRCRKPFIQ